MKRLLMLSMILLIVSTAQGHVSPPRMLMSDMEAVRQLLPDAQIFGQMDMKLTDAQRKEVKSMANWNPDEKVYKTFIGRDTQGKYRGAVMFIGEITVHGLVRLAIGVDAEGKVRGANVVAITDEAYGWVKPLIVQGFMKQFVGKGHHDSFIEGERAAARRNSMPQFYGQVIASLVQRCAVICYVSDMQGKAAKS